MRLTSVLIIDDSPTDLMILSALLGMAGTYDVAQAADGFVALEQLFDRVPDVCLVDFDMPGMTGLDFASRARIQHPGLQCILVTGTPPADLADAARKAGVNTIISKASLTPQVLDATIKTAIGARVE